MQKGRLEPILRNETPVQTDSNSWQEPPRATNGSVGSLPSRSKFLRAESRSPSPDPLAFIKNPHSAGNGARNSSPLSDYLTDSTIEIKTLNERSKVANDIAEDAVTGKRKRATTSPAPPPLGYFPITPSKRKPKRVKISPVKNRRVQRDAAFPIMQDSVDGNSIPRMLAMPSDDPTKFNEDLCTACNGTGRFLCCESCPRSFHFTCIEPPIDEDNIPENSWFCNTCRVRRYPPEKPPRGLFSDLLDQMARRNPAQFRLPKSLRTYFEGVGTGDTGEYIDTGEAKSQKLGRSGFYEDSDALKLKGKNGEVILCYHCGMSALNGQMVVTCDFCYCSWHLDCVDPPLFSMPQSNKKWMCPNHAQLFLKSKRIPKRHRILDVSLRRGFQNDGDIEVNNEEEELEDLERRTFENEFVIENVKYRLPERGIKLDFLDKVATTTKFLPRKADYVGRQRQRHARKRPPSVDSEEFDMALQLQDMRTHMYPDNLAQLVELALTSAPKAELVSPASVNTGYKMPPMAIFSTNGGVATVNKREAMAEGGDGRVQLLALRALMQVKGKEALMSFLAS